MPDTNSNYWINSYTTSNTWTTSIQDGTSAGTYVSVGTQDITPINPWVETNLDYRIGRDRYSYAENDNTIKVDKGSPSKARYAIFYAVNKDPVIFCRTRREMYKEVKKLLKRKEVDYKSIRIFALIGGAKIVKDTKAIRSSR